MKRLLALSVLVFSVNSLALTPPFIVEKDGVSLTGLETLSSQIEKGSIVLLGELHDNADHHKNQLAVVETLISNGHNVHLGMEFLNYTDQYEIYKYGAGLSTKEDFLKAVEWQNLESFEFYSPMLDAVHSNNGSVLGLNIPRPITSKVAKNGIGSLNKSELALLPHPLTLGSDFYFERFYLAVGGEHVPEDKIKNYFWSQSVWDDVMSWQAIEFMNKNPNDTLVIIVGDFHVSYGGGLAEVLKRKGFDKVKNLSQTKKGSLSDADLSAEIAPHPTYGHRADWIWVTK